LFADAEVDREIALPTDVTESDALGVIPFEYLSQLGYARTVIRATGQRRFLAWVGLLAILLVALAPTVSQLRAARGDAHGLPSSSDIAHAAHGPESALAIPCGHDPGGKAPDDCWRKCGYCGFLTDTPAAAGIAFVSAPVAATASPPSGRVDTRHRHDPYGIAAQPRGPPQTA